MDNQVLNDLRAIHVKQLHRVTLADGKLLNYFVLQPLFARDNVLAEYFTSFSANTYHNDLANNIYHYVNNEKDYNIHIKDDATLSAYNTTVQSVSATALTATNYRNSNDFVSTAISATSYSGTDLAIDNNFIVNLFSIGQPGFTPAMQFSAAIDKITTSAAEINAYINANEETWCSLSAIQLLDNNGSTTLPAYPAPLVKIQKGTGVGYAWNSSTQTLTISSSTENNVTVEDHVIICTN